MDCITISVSKVDKGPSGTARVIIFVIIDEINGCTKKELHMVLHFGNMQYATESFILAEQVNKQKELRKTVQVVYGGRRFLSYVHVKCLSSLKMCLF